MVKICCRMRYQMILFLKNVFSTLVVRFFTKKIRKFSSWKNENSMKFGYFLKKIDRFCRKLEFFKNGKRGRYHGKKMVKICCRMRYQMILFLKNVFSTLVVRFFAKKNQEISKLEKLESLMKSIYSKTLLSGIFNRIGKQKICLW